MRRAWLVGTLALVVAALWTPAPAAACGGLVCDGGGPVNQVAVDQAGERILFLVEDDGMGGTVTTAVIQIQYEGYADDFAWVLPVPSVPETVEVAPDDFFDALDAATAPTFQFNVGGTITGGGRVGGGPSIGCGAQGPSASDAGAFSPDEEGGGGSPVNVWGTGVVGPYDLSIISSDVVDPLVEWIQRHGYAVPDRFIEIADEYVKENYKFIVLRLAPDAGIDQISPLVVRYREAAPCVPLRLTSIAAVADMGVRVYVVGAARAVPLNWTTVAPDWTKLAVSPNGVNDYDALIAEEIDLAGGHGWVTEWSDSSAATIGNAMFGLPIADPYLVSFLPAGATVTRLYTKVSPWEMDEDPFFQFDTSGSTVSNFHMVNMSGTMGASVLEPGAALAGEALLLVAVVAWRLSRRRARPMV